MKEQGYGGGKTAQAKFPVAGVPPKRMVEFAEPVDGDGDPDEVADERGIGMKQIVGDFRVMAVKARPQGDEIRRVHGYEIVQDEAKRHDLPSLKRLARNIHDSQAKWLILTLYYRRSHDDFFS